MCRAQLARTAFWRWCIVYGWVLYRLFPLSLEKQLVSVNPHIPKTRGSNDQRAMGEFPKNDEPSVRPGASVGSPGTTVTKSSRRISIRVEPRCWCVEPHGDLLGLGLTPYTAVCFWGEQANRRSHRFTELWFGNVCECCPWAVSLCCSSSSSQTKENFTSQKAPVF